MVGGLEKPKILLVYFARENSEYDYLHERDEANFKWASPGKKFDFTIANKDKFADQARVHDVLLFAGGNSRKLISSISKMNLNLLKLFEGKIISGSSAGAHMISEWYYGHGEKNVKKGLGLLPVNVFTHYHPAKGTEFWLPDNRVKQIETKLINKSGRKETITIREQEFVIIKV